MPVWARVCLVFLLNSTQMNNVKFRCECLNVRKWKHHGSRADVAWTGLFTLSQIHPSCNSHEVIAVVVQGGALDWDPGDFSCVSGVLSDAEISHLLFLIVKEIALCPGTDPWHVCLGQLGNKREDTKLTLNTRFFLFYCADPLVLIQPSWGGKICELDVCMQDCSSTFKTERRAVSCRRRVEAARAPCQCKGPCVHLMWGCGAQAINGFLDCVCTALLQRDPCSLSRHRGTVALVLVAYEKEIKLLSP